MSTSNHRHLDRHGEGWAGVREGVSTDEGWPLYLSRYADLLTADRITEPPPGATMTTTSIDIDRPAEQVYAYVTDPTQFHEWQQGVVSGGLKEPGPAASAPTARWCAASAAPTDPPHRCDQARPTHDLGRARHRRTDPRPGRGRPFRPSMRPASRVTIDVDFEGHGIGKVLVPLVVRRQAAKEMPANLPAPQGPAGGHPCSRTDLLADGATHRAGRGA